MFKIYMVPCDDTNFGVIFDRQEDKDRFIQVLDQFIKNDEFSKNGIANLDKPRCFHRKKFNEDEIPRIVYIHLHMVHRNHGLHSLNFVESLLAAGNDFSYENLTFKGKPRVYINEIESEISEFIELSEGKYKGRFVVPDDDGYHVCGVYKKYKEALKEYQQKHIQQDNAANHGNGFFSKNKGKEEEKDESIHSHELKNLINVNLARLMLVTARCDNQENLNALLNILDETLKRIDDNVFNKSVNNETSSEMLEHFVL